MTAVVSGVVPEVEASEVPAPALPRKRGRPPSQRTPEEVRVAHGASMKKRLKRLRAEKLCTNCGLPTNDASLCDGCLERRRLRRAQIADEQNSANEYTLNGQPISIKGIAAIADRTISSTKAHIQKGMTPEAFIESAFEERLRVKAEIARLSRPEVSPEQALAALAAHDNCVSAAARAVKLPRTTYRKLLARARLRPPYVSATTSVVPPTFFTCNHCKEERTRDEMTWGGKLRAHCSKCEEERAAKRRSPNIRIVR